MPTSLESELELAQRQVRTDSLSMSIGELATMYADDELAINPVFQRLFRWEPHQKSKLIESILLGIPIPPIFLFETNKGHWELIDGLQRISTIFEFMGVLKKPKSSTLVEPSVMSATSYLSHFDNVVWERTDRISSLDVAKQVPLEKPMQFEFRRARLNLQILKRPSDVHTKFDLFQRLNSGGSIANPQEVRNCAVIMASEDYYHFLEDLAAKNSFKKISRITEAGETIQKPLEYVMRFVTFLFDNFDQSYDVEEFIDKKIIDIADQPQEYGQIENLFEGTFDLLFEAAGDDALRRYDATSGRFMGKVGQVALEGVAVGVARNLNGILQQQDPKGYVLDRIKKFWQAPEVKAFSKPGLSGGKRMQSTLPFGAAFFKP